MTLPPDVIAYLDKIGNGNRSGAVVMLVREREDHEYVDCPRGGCSLCSGAAD